MKYPHDDIFVKSDLEQMRCEKTIFKAPKLSKEVPKTVGETPVKPK